MSTRLTNHSREQIAKAVLTHRFNDDIVALTKDRAALADAVYCDIYSKSVREQMAALPKGWLPEATDIGAKFGETSRGYDRLPFAGTFYGVLNTYRAKSVERIERRIQTRHLHGCAKVYADDHKLAKRAAELDARKDELTRTISEAERQVNAALASASTVNKLVEMWPEVEPFARSSDKVPLKVPTVPTDTLNKMLDLPVAA